ncbi:uncharacterized protein LOC128850707 isoform X1 [Cuculus canorus]|uniref:uncharacterized protein LOC128850707 isoform X1 n=1 Tax=Cuculus canorus TaxID=55661 RepID=UPI0023AA9905|nr:uncharacterized protein LOC128850707 isoform X1 [Cuculus canorus]XP_053911665.1 uncharacterized protein LOC128850707 isoform X1 [Cuculus canorus]
MAHKILIGSFLLFCITPPTCNQHNTGWPWSQAFIEHSSFLGNYPKDRHPNLAVIVMHDDEAYLAPEWVWDGTERIRTLSGIIDEKIQVGCRKVESGFQNERASSISVRGNFLNLNITSKIHPGISEKLCPTEDWKCTRQDTFILCCRQKFTGNNTSWDPNDINVEVTKSCKKEQGDCWLNFTMVNPISVVCNWKPDPKTRPTLLGLTQKFRVVAVTKPKLVAILIHQDRDISFVLNSKEAISFFTVAPGEDISVRCQLMAESLVEPVNSYGIGPRDFILSCRTQGMNCWLNFTAVKTSYKVVCGKNNTRHWGELIIKVLTPTTPPKVTLQPKIYEIGPFVVGNTGQQQMLFKPEWSLKRVELLMQNNVSEIQPACTPFLHTSYEGWTTWLRRSSQRRITRDLTGVLGTRLGVLNSIDSEVLMNKLATTTYDLAKMQQPLRSSLLALGTHQWLLSNILPKWEKMNVKDHKLILDTLGVAQSNISLALSCIQAQLWMQTVAASIIREGEEGIFPTEIRKIIWDNANNFEQNLQSWWKLVNFTYDPVNNVVTAYVLTIHNASVFLIYPVYALGLNHNGTILYPFEHRAWAQRVNDKWQTVDLESCIVREQLGVICENNAIRTQDFCLDTDQKVCHFEVRPEANTRTVIIYIGNGCVCLRTICNNITVGNVIVYTNNHTNFCVCNFTEIIGCDFSYSAPVTSHQILKSNLTLIHEIIPVSIGMNTNHTKELVQHQDYIQILEEIKKNGQKTLITVHHSVDKLQRIMKKVKSDGEHNWWDTLFGWSPTATGILNKLCHPIVVLLILSLVSIILSVTLYIFNWRMIKRMRILSSTLNTRKSLNVISNIDIPKSIDIEQAVWQKVM